MAAKHHAIIGAGINGLAVARELLIKFPNDKVSIFDKEPDVALHQSSHNSGVVHAGLYYEPGSLKANLCREGAVLLRKYCALNNLPYDECGKIVVALTIEEHSRLNAIYKRALANNVPGIRLLNENEIKDIEPNCIGTKALYSPSTAIVSYLEIARTLAKDIKAMGGNFMLAKKVIRIIESGGKIALQCENEDYYEGFNYALTCAGLHSDRIAINSGDIKTPKIVPFFGQYYVIDERFKNHVKGLIYPVPDPKYPFLGVHFTKRIDGNMTIGPNAFISLGRENYEGSKPNFSDIYDFITYAGFWKFSFRNKIAAIHELKGVLSQSNFVSQATKYVPSLAHVSVKPAIRGIRAQAMELDGSLVDDFVIRRKGNIVHIRNAPSPGATSSLAIAKYIVEEVMDVKNNHAKEN